MALDLAALRQLRTQQDGVVARRQVIAAGGSPHDVRRLLRRREWAVVLPGVYVDHTGPPTWRQRSWAAVLHAWPSALAAESALRAHAGPGWRGCDERMDIQVAVDTTRTVVDQPGVRVRRSPASTPRFCGTSARRG